MPDLFRLEDLTVEIPSQRKDDPTNENNNEEEENDG
tara:strand:- start:730 stop:837 length:108 start_codon:yes stop_codon:yes gene_type:complete